MEDHGKSWKITMFHGKIHHFYGHFQVRKLEQITRGYGLDSHDPHVGDKFGIGSLGCPFLIGKTIGKPQENRRKMVVLMGFDGFTWLCQNSHQNH